MAVAVLLPVYNGDDPDHFEQALLSVINQEQCPEEIHIYLGIDGPLDQPLEDVVSKYSDNIFTLVRNQENVGPTVNLNRLIEKLQGEELVFRMDADDISHPLRFRKQIDFMAEHPDIGIIGSSIEEVHFESGSRTLRKYPVDPEVMKDYICVLSPLAHPSVCMRTQILLDLGGYPNIRGQDLALWIEALARGIKISNIDEPLLILRINSTFFQRRKNPVRMIPEFKLFLYGVWRLHGFTWKYIFPVTKFLFRLTPARFARYLYGTELRNRHVETYKR